MAHQTHAIESIKLEYFLYATTCIWLQIWSQIDVTCIGYNFDHQVAKLALPHCIDWDCPTVFTSWYQVCVFIIQRHINKVKKISYRRQTWLGPINRNTLTQAKILSNIHFQCPF